MVNTAEIYIPKGGDYMKGDDMEGVDDTTLTIEGVEVRKLGNDEKAVVSFKETDALLPINKTNADTLNEISGKKDTDDWIGLEVTLYGVKVEYNRKMVNSIRIRPPVRETGKKASFVKKEPSDADAWIGGDEIPF